MWVEILQFVLIVFLAVVIQVSHSWLNEDLRRKDSWRQEDIVRLEKLIIDLQEYKRDV